MGVLVAIPETDLTKITRESKTQRTEVFVEWGHHEQKLRWLTLGQSRLRRAHDRDDGCWQLAAYLTAGVTDFEHDSAYALQLPLVGLHFKSVEYQRATFEAWVDPNPNDLSSFHVPRPGYNPMKLPEAYICKMKGQCAKEPHIIVPEGFYVPPVDEDLWLLVRGRRVEIRIGPVPPTLT
jgi:hypothetical protein